VALDLMYLLDDPQYTDTPRFFPGPPDRYLRPEAKDDFRTGTSTVLPELRERIIQDRFLPMFDISQIFMWIEGIRGQDPQPRPIELAVDVESMFPRSPLLVSENGLVASTLPRLPTSAELRPGMRHLPAPLVLTTVIQTESGQRKIIQDDLVKPSFMLSENECVAAFDDYGDRDLRTILVRDLCAGSSELVEIDLDALSLTDVAVDWGFSNECRRP
jgi:hypothetical protein